ncbi:DUF4232 domain-containing protein [Streptomyces sp. NPDC002580]|uniref:DUF4232 domain-containing protein n=1 Tax=Streptomyces sp. NPDC002580 TaxID=3364653 RepID=UPI0036800DD4
MNTPARRNHKNLRGWKPYAFGAAAAAVLLAATACQPGAAGASGGSKPSDRPSETASAKPGGASGDASGDAGAGGGTASSGSTGTGTGGGGKSSASGGRAGSTDGGSTGVTGGSKGSGGTADSGSADRAGGTTGGKEAIATCSQKDLGVSSVKERDNRHLVLTVQNAGDRKCNLYRFPLVRLGAGTRDTPVIKDSDPDPGKPVTLEPGREAYAALLVSRGGMDEYEVKRLTIRLQNGKPGSGAGSTIDVPMPAASLYADDGQLVTYWTTASGYALDFIMSK